MQFYKYHALGNDYIVLDPATALPELSPTAIELICHRHFGIGSDGILLGPLPIAKPMPGSSTQTSFGLRIFNPDGSEAEKSGNGLRIFSRYLWDLQRVGAEPFQVETPGGWVECRVSDRGRTVMVEMGQVSFDSDRIPVAGPQREVLNENIIIGDRCLTFSAATVGNPHCVLIQSEISAAETCALGPDLERNDRFPNRTNVQFVKIMDRQNIQIEIWERGAGYTLASGSSACACAAVAVRLGLCDKQITVHMPGGELLIQLSDDYALTMTGPVTAVAHGELASDLQEEVRAR